MKNLFLMIGTIFLSLSLFGQKYSKVLDQKMSPEDLAYMPLSELRLLKNELIATKGADLKSMNEAIDTLHPSSPTPFLDTISEANVKLLTDLEINKNGEKNLCTDQELYDHFIKIIHQQQKIPFYLQVRFLGACQNPNANIYLLPVSDRFNTVVLSEHLVGSVGPEQHRIITLDLKGSRIDQKIMHGNAQFKDNKIIHESFNSLIEYTYTIDAEGKFDKKTPTKER